jgi:transposase
LLRDFNRIGQRQGLAGTIGRRLLRLGLVMFRWRDQGKLRGEKLEGLQRRVRTALERGAARHRFEAQDLRTDPLAAR